MKIDVACLKDGVKYELSHEYDPETEKLNFDDCFCSQPLVLKGWALKEGNVVTVSVTVTTVFELTCSRCLDVFSRDVTEGIQKVYDGAGKKSIDITEDIREHFIFMHSQQYLCDEMCKGICPFCGANLNAQLCNCHGDDELHPFAQLKSWKNKEKEN